ncbi:hypothetical protein [Mesorhizobium sp. M0847]|uniref:hypothetical protein n=1 Tax=unclassified Mesorhizobium TaxID=325217 RepID=UPI00333ABF4D
MPRKSEKQQANTIDTATAAALIKVTPRYIQKLSGDGWFKPIGRGRWNLIDVVQGYITCLKDDSRQASKSAADSRVRDARAREIEMRIAREERKLIAMEECNGCLDQVVGGFITMLSVLPAQITKDVRERQRIEAIIDAGRQRLSDNFAKLSNNLRSGDEPDDDDDEEES